MSDAIEPSVPWEYAPAPESTAVVTLEDSYGLFINGEFVEPKSGKRFVTINPATEEPLAQIAEAGPEDVALAVEAARDASDAWRALPGCRAREVPLPDRAPAPGAGARVRGAGVDERRQADQGVARHRHPARGRALLLLRGLGRQAGVRVPRPAGPPHRRCGPDHPVELPDADGRVEARARPRDREHAGAEAGRDHAADRAAARAGHPGGGAASGRGEHRDRRRRDRSGVGGRARRQDRVHRIDRGGQARSGVRSRAAASG